MIPPLSAMATLLSGLSQKTKLPDPDGPGFADLMALADAPDADAMALAPAAEGDRRATTTLHRQGLPSPVAAPLVAPDVLPAGPDAAAGDNIQPLQVQVDVPADATAQAVAMLHNRPSPAPDLQTDLALDAQSEATRDLLPMSQADLATAHHPSQPLDRELPDAAMAGDIPQPETPPTQTDTAPRVDRHALPSSAGAQVMQASQPLAAPSAAPSGSATSDEVAIALPDVGADPLPASAPGQTPPALAPATSVAEAAPAVAVSGTAGRSQTPALPSATPAPVLPVSDVPAPPPLAEGAHPPPLAAAAAPGPTTSLPTPATTPVFTLTQPNWPVALASGPVVALLDLAGGSMVLDLAPDDLGRMTVTLQVQGDAISVRFQTETPEAARLLAEGERQLAAELARLGMTLAGHDASADRRPTQRGGWTRRPEVTVPDGAAMTLAAPAASGRINLLA